ncbi:MAG TPA: SMR family transporter [Gammaproteobacteria bacterium]|nr:SMR family transporter [Gammaproteobacteria bacterium]
MYWGYLFFAICSSIGTFVSAKLSQGFTVFMPFTLAIREIDLSVAYSIGCAMGMVVCVIIDVWYFNASMNHGAILAILMIIVCTVYLITSTTPTSG